jgi:hypothetical protein
VKIQARKARSSPSKAASRRAGDEPCVSGQIVGRLQSVGSQVAQQPWVELAVEAGKGPLGAFLSGGQHTVELT